MNFFLIIILGIIAGFIAGAFGISAGPILVPGLLLFSLTSGLKSAIGTTILTIIPPLSIFAGINYYRQGYVDIKLALLLMVSVVFGTLFGSNFTILVKPRFIAYATSAILAVLSVFWFYCARTGMFIDSKDIGAL
jgi:hypothetical protein